MTVYHTKRKLKAHFDPEDLQVHESPDGLMRPHMLDVFIRLKDGREARHSKIIIGRDPRVFQQELILELEEELQESGQKDDDLCEITKMKIELIEEFCVFLAEGSNVTVEWQIRDCKKRFIAQLKDRAQ